jgi:hypothetical protein
VLTTQIGDRLRDSTQNLPHRATTPTNSSLASNRSRSGTSTPEQSTGPAVTPNVSSVLISPDVRDYMRSSTSHKAHLMVRMRELLLIVAWQKYYDEALAQEKSPLPTTILYGSPSSGATQQGWNTVGGKPPAKGANPWGAQNSKSYF